MTPEICLISVPHNGTQFTREIFVTQGWTDVTLVGRPSDKPVLYQGHCEKMSQVTAAIDLGERMPVIMPIRHPFRVEESWRRRGKNTLGLLAAYHHMLEWMGPIVKIWLPIDANPMVSYVAHRQLNLVAGKPLGIDWGRVIGGEKNTHDVPLADLDPSSEIMDIRRHPLFSAFYGEEDSHAPRSKPACSQSARPRYLH